MIFFVILRRNMLMFNRFKISGPDGSNYWVSHGAHFGGSDADDAWFVVVLKSTHLISNCTFLNLLCFSWIVFSTLLLLLVSCFCAVHTFELTHNLLFCSLGLFVISPCIRATVVLGWITTPSANPSYARALSFKISKRGYLRPKLEREACNLVRSTSCPRYPWFVPVFVGQRRSLSSELGMIISHLQISSKAGGVGMTKATIFIECSTFKVILSVATSIVTNCSLDFQIKFKFVMFSDVLFGVDCYVFFS